MSVPSLFNERMSFIKLENEEVHNTEEEQCFLCGKQNKTGSDDVPLQQCASCQKIWYCSEDHYEVHRHKDRCFPFLIKRSPTKGRFMVATRDIEPLEMILWEKPAVIGPYTKDASGCLQCFKHMTSERECSQCGLPVCSQKCEQGRLHQEECRFFRNRSQLFPKEEINVKTRNATQTCITPLRMLLKRKTDPKAFARIEMLMDHATSKLGANRGTLNMTMLKVVCMIREQFHCSDFTKTDIQRMIGILKTNGMKLETAGENGTPGVALYPIYCLINHACINNTNYVKYPDLHLELRSQLPIKKGTEILTRYISSTVGNVRRREDIERYWFFRCECPRCSDSTEFGTFMSGVRCFQCRNGFLLQSEINDLASDWACNRCSSRVPHKNVNEVLTTIEKQTDLDAPLCIETMEEMLFHYQKLLHPNNYIIIDIMHNLIHLYAGKESLTRPEKERKIQLCHIVLDILGRVDPGFTTWRGTLLQEMIHTLMVISKEDHNAARISEKEFHRRLNYCSRKLREAKLCLNGGFTPLEVYLKEKEQQMGDLENDAWEREMTDENT
ncbi:SET domain-containing protein SmydA-8-like isoform X1 [Tigriopus californicus]|uniref:SET domain-containing protein SmydA-8-like isoform X1 n=2 Tax=Tigriopus californicus TaxID=6832 RepID=UPI0027DA3817|nr:SET domain-containing protein SmydA-8-like isoform X1 [Tigriopus californicus]